MKRVIYTIVELRKYPKTIFTKIDLFKEKEISSSIEDKDNYWIATCCPCYLGSTGFGLWYFSL